MLRQTADHDEMNTSLPKPDVSSVVILAAAVELQRTHGTEFAARFLEPYGFDQQVVDELLQSTSTNKYLLS